MTPSERRVNAQALHAILTDRSIGEEARDDAAMDLSYSDDPSTVAVLIDFILDPAEPNSLVGVAAESLGEIWARSRNVDAAAIRQMRPIAQRELLGAMRAAGVEPPNLSDHM
jgi:hypothetical protein